MIDLLVNKNEKIIMYKITDVDTLGREYKVVDPRGNNIGKIQIIPHSEIISATIGEYSEEYGTFENYLTESIAVLSGFDKIDPKKVMWYATTEDEIELLDVIEIAVKNGFDKIILEYLEEMAE
jgi:hypothetical protein